jgi:hypothetical protein
MQQIVIIPGGFHPFHAGHFALYQKAQQKFPNADVYIAATDDTSERPFPFALKEKLARLAGVPAGKFVRVKSPFSAEEITNRYDPEKTNLIFVKSAKNRKGGPSPEGPFPAEPDPATGKLPLVTRGPRKGQPVSDRLQYYKDGQPMAAMNRHAYLDYLPTVEFGPGMTNASQIRAAWPKLNERQRTALVMSMYPATQSNKQLADTVVKMLDVVMNTVQENQGWAATYEEDLSPLSEYTTANTQGAGGGLRANYQQRENQPMDESEDYLEEKWSQRYKRSINCANPRGFSQKAHCAGRKK